MRYFAGHKLVTRHRPERCKHLRIEASYASDCKRHLLDRFHHCVGLGRAITLCNCCSCEHPQEQGSDKCSRSAQCQSDRPSPLHRDMTVVVSDPVQKLMLVTDPRASRPHMEP